MEGSFDWDTNTAKAYTNDTITVNAITDLAAAPAFTVSDPTVLSATPNTTGSAWTIRGKSAGTATITIDTTNIQSSISTLTVTVEDGHYLNQRGLARVWSKVKNYVSTQISGYDASWLAATPPVVATAEQADALCQAISDGVPIYLRYEDVPQGDPYITYATDASTTGGEPVVTFLTGALNGTKTARTYTISRGGMGVQGSVYSSTTTLVDTQSGRVGASNIDFSSFATGAPASLGWSGTSTQSYTAPSLGIVMIQTAVTAGKSVTVSINNTNVAQASAPGSSYTWIPITVLVTAGDVVKATSSDSGSAAQIQSSLCKFIPLGAPSA